MNKYEAMIIFPESLKDIEEALGKVRAEIKKHGGEVESTTRLGKRVFARKMDKQDAGQYVIMTFKMAAEQIKPLMTRFKMNEEIFRVQIVRAPAVVAAAATAGAEAKTHGES